MVKDFAAAFRFTKGCPLKTRLVFALAHMFTMKYVAMPFSNVDGYRLPDIEVRQ